ncbi:Translin-associated protein X [Labeo rohita]|uniref:Translin-associated protein X n=1 Tax=Labeo rohita TaxID=84645 RepID=A0ABQ8M655_LABRO|nr:Translin-associated protein X [Labeo rohita]
MSKREDEGCHRKRKTEAGPKSEDCVNPNSAVIAAFKVFQQELDTKHDKYERLVKISRDITIESKRTIFLLHRVTSVPDVEEILNEADVKLDSVRQKIGQIAEELKGEDLHQFHRAFTPEENGQTRCLRTSEKSVDKAGRGPTKFCSYLAKPLKVLRAELDSNCRRCGGIQEYVEAVSFHHFIKHRSLISLEEINARLVFMRENNKGEAEVAWTGPSVLTFHITPTDYLLGVADLTGELMRMCISSVGNGDIDTPFQLSGFLREIHDGFSYIGNTGPYEVSKKLHTLRQSLGKVEDACYTLRVRGSEIPKHMLADVFTSRAAAHLDPDDTMV